MFGPRNRMISSDYPGVTRDVIEDAMGDACVCIFLQGAAGDINPLFLARGDDRGQNFEIVDAMGAALADEVKRTLTLMKDATGKSDDFTYLSSRETFRHRFDPDQELDLGATTLLINDDIALTTMSGEPFHRFAKEFREKTDVPHAYLLGYCGNGDYGWARYLPDLVSAARGGMVPATRRLPKSERAGLHGLRGHADCGDRAPHDLSGRSQRGIRSD